jgi:hypothetical protein
MSGLSSIATAQSQLWLAAVISILAMVLIAPPASHAYDWAHPGEGPWRGQVVDRQTRQPLDGVVVVAVWDKRYGSVGGWAGGGYFASEEVVTGLDGRFTIQSLKKIPFDPFAIIKGPEFYVFKGGYGEWQFPGQHEWQKLDVDESMKRLDEAWRLFNGDGVVIELTPLKTREARLRFMSLVSTPMSDVPQRDIQKYRSSPESVRPPVKCGG